METSLFPDVLNTELEGDKNQTVALAKFEHWLQERQR